MTILFQNFFFIIKKVNRADPLNFKLFFFPRNLEVILNGNEDTTKVFSSIS